MMGSESVVSVGGDKSNMVFLNKTGYHANNMFEVITDVGVSFSSMSVEEGKQKHDVAERLDRMEEEVIDWDSDQSMIFDRGPEASSKYLDLVDQIRILTQSLGNNELLTRGHNILQLTMARLEEELVHLLTQYQQPLDPGRMSFRSTEEDFSEDFSSSSFGDEVIEGRLQNESSDHSEEFVIDLIQPTAVSQIKCIAEMMFLSNYEKECCQAYIGIRKEALDECLSILKVERLSIEEILRMDWNVLNGKIKRWNRAVKFFVRVYLASEKRLCELVFSDLSQELKELCFVETSKACTIQLLNFGEAVAIAPPRPEKLFRILDMYEGLAEIRSDMDFLFAEESSSTILTEFKELIRRLSEAVGGILTHFKNEIKTNTSATPYPGGKYHPLTRYVMNYLLLFPDYNYTLNILLENSEVYNDSSVEVGTESLPTTRLLYSLTSILEANLVHRSMLYRDLSLQHIFMMNNIYYMVKKVENSDLRTFFGDDWIGEHTIKFRQHALNYKRATWNPVLSFLREEGISNPGSSSPSRSVLKDRFQSFNLAFEEVYRTQTGWSVPAKPLRDDLRMSISIEVLLAYPTFFGRYASYLDGVRHRDRFIKYSADDLENFLMDLFEGEHKSLSHRW